MDPAAVREVFKLSLRDPTPEERELHKNTKYGLPTYVFGFQLRSFWFRGGMFFIDGRLSMLELISKGEGACLTVKNVLTEGYGQPDVNSNRTAWLDRKSGNAIAVFDLAPILTSCMVQYTPFRSGADAL